jgi:hypothetical protein
MIDLKEKTWEILLERIREKKCTPFLGAGACAGALPLGGELARDLADAQDYPFEDRSDLLHRSPIANFEDQACVWRA